MSSIENLVYSAYELGKREELFKEVSRLRQTTTMTLEDCYDEAYRIVCKTG